MNKREKILTINGLYKGYGKARNRVEVLQGINLSLEAGKVYALVGPSGSGKSTLLHITGLLDTADKGTITIQGEDVTKASDATRTQIRRKKIGFIYQFHHLLPEFSALENVMLPQMIDGTGKKDAADKAVDLLKQVGLQDRLDHRPSQLSGGEQQRVAIVRAIANDPAILLADEPTGNLDTDNANKVFDLILNLARKRNITALIATHNMELADKMDDQLTLTSGKVGKT